MKKPSFIGAVGAVAIAAFVTACGGGGGGGTAVTAPTQAPTATAAPGPTAVPQSAVSVPSFTQIAGAPTTLSSTAQQVGLPAIPGVTGIGAANHDTVTLSSSGGATTVVSVASSLSASVPALQAALRHPLTIGGVNVTPLYYVGVTNTGTTTSTVNVGSLTLGVPTPPTGSSLGLAHYDPAIPQNGWNAHCAIGSGQVTQNGGSTTFVPGGTGATLTVGAGQTVWFAPYVFPSAAGLPTPPPPATPAPAAATPPASLTGSYVGSAMQTLPSTQPAQYLQVSITQSGSSLTGSMAALPSGPNDSGFFANVTGTLNGTSFTLNAVPVGSGQCPATIAGTVTGTLLTGTFTSPACNGGHSETDSGTFSIALQSTTLPAISGSYSGTITSKANGTGSLTFTVNGAGGSVFSGTGVPNWPNPQNNGPGTIVGFVVNATTAEFAIVGTGNGGGGSCQPFGTIAISGNTLTGTYTNGGDSSTGCTDTGTFTISH